MFPGTFALASNFQKIIQNNNFIQFKDQHFRNTEKIKNNTIYEQGSKRISLRIDK